MDTYILYHEDRKLAMFSVDADRLVGSAKFTANAQDFKYLPAGVKDSHSFKNWVYNRGVPVSRHGIGRDLGHLHLRSPFELMLRNHGISLTDHYWLGRTSDSWRWKDINPYENDFKSVYTLEMRDDLPSIAGKTNFVPSASLQGDLKKKWIIGEGRIRYLVKGNYGDSCRQSICEALASKIHEMQGFQNYVPYKLIEISSDGKVVTGCMCPNFTSIHTEFIPAIDIVNAYKKPNSISYYEFYIEVCKNNGVDVRQFLEYQILTDFILSNTDRHLNNFGILRRSDGLRWISSAPIFDSGNSLFYNLGYIPVGDGLLDLDAASFDSKEVRLLSHVTDRSLVDIMKLPDEGYVYDLLKADHVLDDGKRERIARAYSQKIKYLCDFQNGKDLWK